MYYELRSGLQISDGILYGLEICGISEAKIAKIYDISRYYLWVLRGEHFHYRQFKSNKNKMTDEQKREKKKLYMREYRRVLLIPKTEKI